MNAASLAARAPAGTPADLVAVKVTQAKDEHAWDQFVTQHPESTCEHLWAWRTVITSVFGHKCIYLTAERSGAIVGVLPLVLFDSRLFGRSVVSLPFLNYGGVLASEPEAVALLANEAERVGRDFGAAYVELRHRAPLIPSLPRREHKLALTRPLPASSDELWAKVDRKVRNQVRKAQKDGLTVVSGGAELVDQFYKVFARNMRDLGTPVYPKSLFAEALRALGDAARVHLVHMGPHATAGGVTVRHRDTVLVPWASSLREFRTHCPNMLLYWNMLDESVRAGATVFDFGRSSPDSGPHHFKLQWGAQEAPMAWEYILINRSTAPDHGPTSPHFAKLVSLWQKMPLAIANAVGPAIVRHIP